MVARRPRPVRRRRRRRRRVMTRALPVIALAAAAFAVGAVLATSSGADKRQIVRRYLTAWTQGDVARMYSMLDAASRARVSERAFTRRLRADAEAATLASLRVLRIGTPSGSTLPV